MLTGIFDDESDTISIGMVEWGIGITDTGYGWRGA